MGQIATKNLSPADKKQILKVFNRLLAGPGSSRQNAVTSFLADIFVPPGEVPVDTFVIMTSVGEWCVGLEDFGAILMLDWAKTASVAMEVSNMVISAEGDTAWLDASAAVTVLMKNNTLLGSLARRIQGVLNTPDSLSIEQLLRESKAASLGLFEESTGEKFSWEFRLSGMLLRKHHPWRFQQLKFNFLKK